MGGTEWRPSTLNYHTYSQNNPINVVDPTGFAPYVYTEQYGWLDLGHINPAKAEYIIGQVAQAVGHWPAGRSFAIGPQNLTARRLNNFVLAQYTAYYWVSGETKPAQVNGVALGIFMDFERRWESWQGRMLLGVSSYYVEDLPSDYLGFYLAMTGQDLAEALGYLGDYAFVDCAPPRLIDMFHNPLMPPSGAIAPAMALTVLRNTEFTPKVEKDGQWVNVDWPNALQLPVPIDESSGFWRFERDVADLLPTIFQ